MARKAMIKPPGAPLPAPKQKKKVAIQPSRTHGAMSGKSFLVEDMLKQADPVAVAFAKAVKSTAKPRRKPAKHKVGARPALTNAELNSGWKQGYQNTSNWP